MEAQSNDPTPAEHSVAIGASASTPAVAIGATILTIATAFVITLGLAGLAYWLAG
jgi:hypothetical protein